MNSNPINNLPSISGIFLQPGEKISPNFLNELQEVNDRYSKSKDFPKYQEDIRQLFKLPKVRVTSRMRDYLAGFIEGEGGLSAGAKKNTTSKLKVYIDPEFSVTQHINGIWNLFMIMNLFQTGRIRHKMSSNATFVYTIDNRQSLKEKVIPFFDNYVSKFSSEVKKRRVVIFKKLLELFDAKAHLDPNKMIHQVLPLWDAMRMQVGQKNETFQDLQEAQDYVRKAVQDAKQVQDTDQVQNADQVQDTDQIETDETVS
jgi:hypothetical protein